MRSVRRVVVIGLDGLEPSIVEGLLQAGRLPHFAQLQESGGLGRVATTYPAQTPVAWSTFATGVNPGGHGIFDFLTRDPATYMPDLSLSRYETKNAFLPPRVVNGRGGTPVWDVLADAGIHATVLRCPCTYPPDQPRGRLLAGMGVPDIRGGLGTPTFFTTATDAKPADNEQLVRLEGDRAALATRLPGPRVPGARGESAAELHLIPHPEHNSLTIASAGTPGRLEVTQGRWSDWLRLKFRLGPLRHAAGIVRFRLLRLAPDLELYASPVNFDPTNPLFPISEPWDYAGALAKRQGLYYTAGMVEDHTGLNNGRLDESAFLDQCHLALAEREQMMLDELARLDEGLFYVLFDTPDRLQHMFWRFREPDHPANRGHTRESEDLAHVIDEHYERCDAILGRALEAAGHDALVIALSDHGFGSFRRGVHLNTWLLERGLLAIRPDADPGARSADLLRAIDWPHTRAYALGLGGIYLNLAGREAEGTVAREEAAALARAIADGLTGLVDPATGRRAVRSVLGAAELYRGPYLSRAADLLVNFAPGYRASWATARGGVGLGTFEDNTMRWSGDHVMDPPLVPGVLAMNRPFRSGGARLLDLAPTILAALGVGTPAAMEGASLLS